MPKDEMVRLLMHLPNGALPLWWAFGWPVPGFISIEVSWFSIIFGLALLTLFVIYQVFQLVSKGKPWKDQSWKDLQGINWGAAIVGSVLGILWRLL